MHATLQTPSMIKLRPAQFSDHAAIVKLHAESWRQNYRGILSDHFLENEIEGDRAEVWYQRLKFPNKNQIVTIATLDENLVGFSCLFLDDDPVYSTLLDNLHVSMNLQKSGIGKLLMKECAKNICEKSNNRKMYLWVYAANQNARSFYQRLGGINFETLEKQNEDGTASKTCRYVWNDVSVLI